MIIGNGLIASAFERYFADDPGVIVFASGVANSRECDGDAFLRERRMLLDAINRKKFILYFSTCSVSDPELLNTPYVLHKREMECLVQSSNDYVIFRLPQVVGRTPNPNTLTNYLHKKIVSGTHFQVWRYARRNLIDVDDVAAIIAYLVRTSKINRTTANIACPFSISVPQLVSIFETVLCLKACYSLIDAGAAYSIDSGLVVSSASQIGIAFDETYIEKLIRKYYGE